MVSELDNWEKKLNYLSLYTAQYNKSCLAKYRLKTKQCTVYIGLDMPLSKAHKKDCTKKQHVKDDR